jgi:hypothetical protein
MLRGILCQAFRLTLVILPLSSATGSEAPRAVVSETGFDFGQVLRGAVIEHEFTLRNEGNVPLQVRGTRMIAPLTATSLPEEIAPGQAARLRFKLDTSSLKGRFEGWILVSLDDPGLPEARLTFSGRVVPPVELSPRSAFFVAGRRGEPRRASIDIINHESEPLRIDKVEHSTGRFTTALETLEQGRRYRLTLTLDPRGPGGKHSEIILVTTSSRTEPVLRIAANTWLRERVYTFPDTVDLGALRLSDIRTNPQLLAMTAQSLMVYQVGGSNFRASFQCDVQEIDLTWARGPKGDRYQATLTLVADRLRVGPIEGTVVIETNDSEFPRLVVPVSGRIIGP